MSIVEKALSKLQDSARAERRAAAAAPVAPAPVTTAVKPLHAGHHISFDAVALQREGVLPQQVDAMAVRNQFRRLKWPVLDEIAARRRENQPCAGAVMIASALPGEGKTFTAANLALSIAREEDRRVILIDADIPKAHLSDAFGLRERPGLTEYISQPALQISDILVSTSIERLYIVPAGKFVPHVSDLLSSARMQQLIRDLVDSMPGTVVLIDTSPVMATSEAQVLARLVPQILLVVRAEHTPQPTVIEACDILGREKTSAVLNQAHVWMESGAYPAGYGYYANQEKER